jgi:hypothetical protein
MFSVYFLKCWVYTRKCCDNEATDPEMLMNVQIFILPGYEKVIFGKLSVCMYVCVSLEPEQLHGYYSNLVSESLSVRDLICAP